LRPPVRKGCGCDRPTQSSGTYNTGLFRHIRNCSFKRRNAVIRPSKLIDIKERSVSARERMIKTNCPSGASIDDGAGTRARSFRDRP